MSPRTEASRLAHAVGLEKDNIITRALCQRLNTDYLERATLVDRLHCRISPTGETVYLDGEKLCFIGKPVITFDGKSYHFTVSHRIYED